jgi:predicted small lipoprotein YifL
MKYAFILLTLTTLSLTGCGIKPSKLEAPSPNNEVNFPDTYPHAAKITNQQN